MRYHLGMVYAELGRIDEAKSNLETAVSSGESFLGIQEARKKLAEL